MTTTITQLPAPVLLFAIPPQDSEFFATRIAGEEQEEIRRKLKIMAQIHAAKNKVDACTRLSALLNKHGTKNGTSPVRLRTLYYEYKKTGNWRVLWNKRNSPVETVGLPHEFIEFWRSLCENHQRVSTTAHAELIDIWKTGYNWKKEKVKIPGYRTKPVADPATDLPTGWTYFNLSRHTPDKFDLTANRIGRTAAGQMRLKVYTSRVGLRLFEFIQFDDHEYNLKINFAGQVKAMRPRGFTGIDVLSAYPFNRGYKPTLWDADEEKKKALTERDFMWFFIDTLTRFGYRTDDRKTTAITERGTAAIKDAFEERIYNATGGQVLIERSAMQSAPTHAGQFEGRGKGNYRFKALIESFFSVIDNFLASLPGQTGKDRNHSPEQLHGLERYNDQLLKAITLLPEERGARIKLPLFSWNEFVEFAEFAHEKISAVTDHKLEGWHQLGFIAKEWRLNETTEFLPHELLLAEMSEEEQQVAISLINSRDLLRRERRLSRREVFDRFRNELTPLPALHLPILLGADNCVKNSKAEDTLEVRNHVFEFQDREIAQGQKFRFIAADNYGQRFPEGERFMCFVNPFDPSYLVACDAKMRVQAICKPAPMPSRNDIEGIKRALGEARHREAAALAPIAARHAADARARANLHEHNATVITGETKAEARASERDAQKRSTVADDIFSSDAITKPETL